MQLPRLTMVPLILCFICPVHLLCFNEVSITKENRYLENNLFGIIKGGVSTSRECAVECYVHAGCASFGFEPNHRTCHLHKKNSSTATTDLAAKPPWKHSDISHWPKELMGPCADLTCPSKRRCSVHRVTKAPLCLEADVYQPDVCAESMANGSWTEPSTDCTGHYIRLTTPRTSTYTFKQIPTSTLQTITGGTSTLGFLVKTCRDANFGLHTNPNVYDAAMYEFFIGGYYNQKSGIRRCMWCRLADSHVVSSIVSCNEYRPFWLSWKNGVISGGKGLGVGSHTFMEWTPTSPIVINHVSISSYTNNTGTWLFLKHPKASVKDIVN